MPIFLRYSVNINPLISWRLEDCQVQSVNYDWQTFSGGTDSKIELLLGNVPEMVFNCVNKRSSKIGITYYFTFAINSSGSLKETGGEGRVNLNKKISSLIKQIESCKALSEIVEKNNMASAQLGSFTISQERYLNAAIFKKGSAKILWDFQKDKLLISNLPWKDYKYLPGHANSLTAMKDSGVVLSYNDTIITAYCYPDEKAYRYSLKIYGCGDDILETSCEDGITIRSNWVSKTDTLSVDYLKIKVLNRLKYYGLARDYIDTHFKLVQAKAIRKVDYRFLGFYKDNSTLWVRFVFKWKTGVNCIDKLKNDGFLFCVYFTYNPLKDSFEMVRIGTSIYNFYDKITLRGINKTKSVYENNYSKKKKLLPQSNTFIKILPDGHLAIKWGGLLNGGELNLYTGQINIVRPGGMFCIMPKDMSRYRYLDDKYPLNKIQ